jgi:hypothetical protein
LHSQFGCRDKCFQYTERGIGLSAGIPSRTEFGAPSPTESSSLTVSEIAGIATGGLAAIVFFVIGAIYLINLRRNSGPKYPSPKNVITIGNINSKSPDSLTVHFSFLNPFGLPGGGGGHATNGGIGGPGGQVMLDLQPRKRRCC